MKTFLHYRLYIFINDYILIYYNIKYIKLLSIIVNLLNIET